MYARLAFLSLFVAVVASIALFLSSREGFTYQFPEELELDDGTRAKRVEVAGGKTDEVSYAVEVPDTDDGLPARAAYQAMDPKGFRVGEITPDLWIETDHYKVPLSYTTGVDENEEDRVIYERIKHISPEDRAKFLACQGHWTGEKCVFDGDECDLPYSEEATPNSLDRVSRWRNGACEPLPDCRTGFWDGTGCVLAGDPCEGEDPRREHAWARAADGVFACEARPSCNSSWFSESTASCIGEGEECEVSFQKGVVALTDGGQYECKVEMETRDGLRILADKKPVSSEEECYLACLKRADGCFAYSFDGTDCSTAGKAANFAVPDKDSSLRFTPSARLYPVFSAGLVPSGDGVAVEWEPFNSKDFKMFVSRDPDMSNKAEVAKSGDVTPVEPGGDLFFRPEYDIGSGTPQFPRQIHVAAPDGPSVFDASRVVFQVEKQDGQRLAVKWHAPIEEDMVAEIEFHGEDRRRVHPHGSSVTRFDTVGPRTFSLFLKRSNGEEVYSQSVTEEVECEPPKSVVLADRTCAHYTGEWSVGTPSGTRVPVSWSFEFGDGVVANLEIGDTVFENIEPTGEVEEDVENPGETIVRLVIFDNTGSVIEDESRRVAVSCESHKIEWEGRCVDSCPAPPLNGHWVPGDPCELVCNEGFEYFRGSCVPARGATCSETVLGKFVADGRGGCDLDCDSNAYKLGLKCFETCEGNTPPRAYWTNDSTTHRCQLACADPYFEVGLNGCFQKCPAPPNANSLYGHDHKTGLCILDCKPGFHVHENTCVPVKGGECPWDMEIENGEMKSDGQGGCTLDCAEGYEDDGFSTCRRICDGSPAVGAFFDEECNDICEDSRKKVHNGECVLGAGLDCGDAPTGGTSTANGDGTCTKACDNVGMVVSGDECIVPELVCDVSKFKIRDACYSEGDIYPGGNITNGRAIVNSVGHYYADCDEGYKFDPICANCIPENKKCFNPG